LATVLAPWLGTWLGDVSVFVWAFGLEEQLVFW
jgi:hypothetical protein